jgi:membrane-associated phospholipid phosphatase
MTVLSRYRDDDTPPALMAVARDLLVRAFLPALALLGAGLLVGLLVVVPLAGSTGEDRLNLLLRAGRTPQLDGIARVASEIGGVTGNAIICVVAVLVILVWSRRWWLAALPAIALQMHIFVHIVTSTVVARQRPDVEPLDVGQPTSSFPSGHMGATTAQLLVVVLFLCHQVKSVALRVTAAVIAGAYLICLGWSRLYLGMHHLSDVVWGALNGIVCGLVAWLFLRRSPVEAATTDATAPSEPRQLEAAAEPGRPSQPGVARPAEGVDPIGGEA